MLPLALPATPNVVPSGSGDMVRRSRTSSSVDSLLGPSLGTTWKARVRPSADWPIGATAATSPLLCTAVPTRTCSASTASPVAPVGRVATTRSGPLTPGPNFSAVRT